MNQTNIALLGVGAFGYALLKHLDNKQDGSYSIKAYDHLPEINNQLMTRRRHPFIHPDVSVSDMPQFTDSIQHLLHDANIVITAVSSDSTREVMQMIKTHAPANIIILNTAKALDRESGRRLSEIAAEELTGFSHTYAFLAGGMIADDFFHHEPLGTDIACTDETASTQLKSLFESPTLRVYPTPDLVGTEYAAALKNVISILAGIVHGMGFSYGAETHVISTTAQAVGDVCVSNYGALPQTFSIGSQSWGNDMWMSCTGNTRNRQLGILLGQGKPAAEALADMQRDKRLVEGVNTLNIIDNLDGFKEIPAIKLLHDLIVTQTVDLQAVKDYLLTN